MRLPFAVSIITVILASSVGAHADGTQNGDSSCGAALEARATGDLDCTVDRMDAWPDDDNDDDDEAVIDVLGCGRKAQYRLADASHCQWQQVSAPTVDPEQFRNELRLDVGAGGVTGLGSVSYERRASIFGIQTSLGWGFAAAQAGLMVRVRDLPIIQEPGIGIVYAPGLGPGWMTRGGGRFRINIEMLGLEHRLDSGLVLGLGAGWTLGPSLRDCRAACWLVDGFSMRLSVGEWF
jgi:hypothetical protein